VIAPVVVVHGGAGQVPEASWSGHRQGCEAAARAGLTVLEAGGSALDAVEAAVRVLEDDERFNAGTGACLTEDGRLELDAAIMEGTGLRGGAVAALPPFRNPVAIARAALEDVKHLLYAAEGAAAFARRAGFSPAPADALITDAARARLAEVLRGERGPGWAGGTVGAVACDARGRLAAATSTGGMIAKRAGRVGDTPILGAGTYADDEAAAASATGHGEAAIRIGLTRLACELVRGGLSAQAAADAAIARFGARVGGAGGLILVDPRGEVGIAWNTATMGHAVACSGRPVVSGIAAPAPR
jgi:beta-aspartyl-peptidase (threonine type)